MSKVIVKIDSKVLDDLVRKECNRELTDLKIYLQYLPKDIYYSHTIEELFFSYDIFKKSQSKENNGN